MKNQGVKGLHFIHLPKCGGTYAAHNLRQLADVANIGFVYSGHREGGHRYFHEGVYAPAADSLAIAVVRHPLDLLVSLWCWDQGDVCGWGGIRNLFSSFRNFFMYFCFSTDFGCAKKASWYYSVEPFHFGIGLDGEAVEFLIRAWGDESGWETLKVQLGTEKFLLLQLLMRRPLPYSGYNIQKLFEGIDLDELMLPLLDEPAQQFFISTSAVVQPARTNQLYLTTARMASNGSVQAQAWNSGMPSSKDKLASNYEILLKLSRLVPKVKPLRFPNLMFDAWCYTSFMWYSLFEWSTGRLIPDVVIPIEKFDIAFSSLKTDLGVNELQLSADSSHIINAGTYRSGRPWREFYDAEMLQVARHMLHPALEIFGYKAGELPSDVTHEETSPQRGYFTRKDLEQISNRPWRELQTPIALKKFSL